MPNKMKPEVKKKFIEAFRDQTYPFNNGYRLHVEGVGYCALGILGKVLGIPVENLQDTCIYSKIFNGAGITFKDGMNIAYTFDSLIGPLIPFSSVSSHTSEETAEEMVKYITENY